MRLSHQLLVIVIAAAGAGRLSAQGGGPGGTPREVAAAQTLLQAGNADSAITLLHEFFARNPDAVAGRLLLGNAYRQKGDLERALTAYAAVTRPRPVRLQALFNSAGIHALRGNRDAAFGLLAEVKGSGAFDMELANTTPDFESLRGDARYPGILFQPADFERPFVEPIRVIHEWVAEGKGDQYSWIARGIGDADGDGVNDIVTSAPVYGANGQWPGRGRIYLYSGKSGKTLWTWTGSDGEGVGTGLEGAGDVNRDGVPDVIAGAPGSSRAYVLSGRDGSVLHILASTVKSEGFGRAASGAGDQNGDGHADLLVGAPSGSGIATNAGKVYLFSGRDGTVLQVIDGEKEGDGFGSIVAGVHNGRATPFSVGAAGAGPQGRGRVYVYPGPNQPATFVIEADSSGAALGAMFTSFVGDVDGDQVPDIYASDFANSARGPSTGRIYVHSGKTGARLLSLTGEHPGDGFGIGSADVGDVNRDGYDDLVVGAWQYSSVAPSGGRVYLYSGKDGTLLRTITSRVPGETLGFDATGIGDVDGDGAIDLLVTSTWSNVKGFRSGRMFVIAGEVR